MDDQFRRAQEQGFGPLIPIGDGPADVLTRPKETPAGRPAGVLLVDLIGKDQTE
jgi:hypothetical protein